MPGGNIRGGRTSVDYRLKADLDTKSITSDVPTAASFHHHLPGFTELN
jgi:hypothetical protein